MRLVTLLNPLPVLIILLNPLPVLVALKILQQLPGNTLVHTLVHDKYSPACWVSRKLRPKSKTIPCYIIPRIASSRLVYSSSIQYPENVSGSAT